MSSMVSRRPEVRSDSGSLGSPMNHLNDAFWMSIRLGTSRTFSSLENVLRTRGGVVSGNAKPPAGLEREIRRSDPDQGRNREPYQGARFHANRVGPPRPRDGRPRWGTWDH